MKKKPIYYYNNPYHERKTINKDLKNKSGIYMWTNTINNKKYIGSSINLPARLKSYFKKRYMQRVLEKANSLIYKALLKYDYNNFKLEIVEFCNIEDIIRREQYYLDNFILEYNILKIARSLLGYKHNKISKAKMKRTEDNPLRKLHQLLATGHITTVIDIEDNSIKLYDSISAAARYFGVDHSSLVYCIKHKTLYKGKYLITRKNKL